jgi:hypothetical protein
MAKLRKISSSRVSAHTKAHNVGAVKKPEICGLSKINTHAEVLYVGKLIIFP